MTRPGFAFSTRIKVRYAEIDGQRVVFNSRYLEYADVAIGEFWGWTGVESVGAAWTESEFHVRRSEIDYLRPFVWGDTIDVFVRIERIGGSSLTLRLELCHADTGAVHTVITMVSVHVDLASARSMPLPADVVAYLHGLETAP